MNRVYMIGKIVYISEVKFDYYNKCRIYIEVSLYDFENNFTFKCIACDRLVKYVLDFCQNAFVLINACILSDLCCIVEYICKI